MAEQLRQIKELTPEEQAAYFHARRRRLSHAEITKGLFQTHDLGLSGSSIDPVALLGARDRPITFTGQLDLSTATPSGVVLEFGDSTTGMLLSIASGGGDINLSGGSATGGTGAGGNVAVAALSEIGYRPRFAVALHPGAGRGELWLEGERVIVAESASAWSTWCGTGLGSVAAAASGTANTRATGAVTTAPSGVAVVERVRAYQGQLPRQFG